MLDIEELLKSTGYPVKYDHFVKPPKPPYIVYMLSGGNNFSADDVVYLETERIQIELYTEQKDQTAERRVKAALKNAGLYYEQSEEYIESEKLYENIFETEMIGEDNG